MKTLAYTSFMLLVCFAFSCVAMSVDLTKESADVQSSAELNRKIKRSTEELDNLLNEIVSDDELLSGPIYVTEKEKLQNSPLFQYLLLHKPSLVHFIQEKRNLDYRPRLGRRSNDATDQPKPDKYEVYFSPRLGKRSDIFTNYTPRLGRSIISE